MPQYRVPSLPHFHWQKTVITKTLSTPPSSPLGGDRYIISSSPTDDWTGHENSIATWNGTVWLIDLPEEGWFVHINDIDTLYKFDSTIWVSFPYSIGEGTDLAIVQTRKSTSQDFTTTWASLTLDITDLNNHTNIIEHNQINKNRINIKKDGLYMFYYNINIAPQSTAIYYVRLFKNGITDLPESLSIYTDGNNISQSSLHVGLILNAGDYIELQIKGSGSVDAEAVEDSLLLGYKLEGFKGDKGDTGTGSTINIEQDDSSFATNVNVLNFETNMLLVDEGSGKVTVSSSGSGGSSSEDLSVFAARRTSLITNITDTWVDIVFQTVDINNNTNTIELDTTDLAKINFKVSGFYLCNYDTVISDDEVLSRLYKNNNEVILGSNIKTEPSSSDVQIITKSVVFQITAGDSIKLQMRSDARRGDIEESININIIKLDGIKGDTGETGVTGGTIDTQKDNSSIVASTNTLNFTGNCTVTDSGSGKATVNISGSSGSTPDLSISFTGDNNAGTNFVRTRNGSWTTAFTFIFKGTTITGNPSICKIVSSMSDSEDTGQLRIYDVTNDEEVFLINNITGQNQLIYSNTSFSNLPTTEAIFEIQILSDDDYIYIYSFLLQF